MDSLSNIEVKTLWEKKIEGEILGIGCLGRKGPLVLAERERACHIISLAGKVLKSIKLENPILSLDTNRSSTLFAFLDTEGTIYGFSAEAVKKWKYNLKGAESIALGNDNEIISKHPPYKVVYLDAGSSTKPIIIKCLFSPLSFCMMNKDPLKLIIAGKRGEIGLANGEGKFEWEFNIGISTGEISYDPVSDMIIVPAMDDGIHIYDSKGEPAEILDAEGVVTGAVIKSSSTDAPIIGAIIDDKSFAIMDIDGTVFWEKKSEKNIADWDVGDNFSWLSIARTSGETEVYALDLQPEHTSVISPGQYYSEVSGQMSVKEEDNAGSENNLSGIPKPKEARILGDVPLMGGLLPKDEGRMRLTPSGERIAVSLPGGEVIVIDTESTNILIETRIKAPAKLLDFSSDDFFGVWNSEKLIIIDNKNRQTQSIGQEAGIMQADSSDDLQTIALISANKELVVSSLEDGELVREQMNPPPKQVRVSPGGDTILVEDKALRFLLLDREGNLKRKQKFGGQLSFDHLLLSENYCIFGSEKGPLIIQDMAGKVIFAKKIQDGVKQIYPLDNSFAVYENSGKCRIINWEGATVWRFEPPPGKYLIKTPPDSDPIIFQARRKMLTAFTGYNKQLSTLWAYRCEDTIESFVADRDCSIMAVAAGERIHFVGPPD